MQDKNTQRYKCRSCLHKAVTPFLKKEGFDLKWTGVMFVPPLMLKYFFFCFKFKVLPAVPFLSIKLKTPGSKVGISPVCCIEIQKE